MKRFVNDRRTIGYTAMSYIDTLALTGCDVTQLQSSFVNMKIIVEYYLLGISPASELSESTFRNLVSFPSS
jgi:hypothetical protein